MKTTFCMFLLIVTGIFSEISAQNIQTNSKHFEIGLNSGCVATHIIPIRGGNVNINTVVTRPQFGLQIKNCYNSNKFYSITIFAGKDCLKLFNYGIIANYGWQYEYFDFSLALGCYHRRIGAENALDDRYCWKNFEYMPLVGVNLDLHLLTAGRFQINLNNLITPAMLVNSIGLLVEL